jgi:hypothetical protein
MHVMHARTMTAVISFKRSFLMTNEAQGMAATFLRSGVNVCSWSAAGEGQTQH